MVKYLILDHHIKKIIKLLNYSNFLGLIGINVNGKIKKLKTSQKESVLFKLNSSKANNFEMEDKVKF